VSYTLTCTGTPPPSAATLSVTGSATATANTTYNFTVTAKDSSNAIVTSYNKTVQFSSSDTTATYSSQSYTFLGTEGGTKTFSITFHTSGTHTITVTDNSTPNLSGTLTGIVVGAGTATNFKITTTSTTTTVGTTYNFTVTAQDGSNTTVNDYIGTVQFSSTDTTATFSNLSYTFLKTDKGTKTFSVTFNDPGSGTQTFTVNDNSTPVITKTSGSITVIGKATKFSVTSKSGSTKATVGTAYNVTVTAQDINGKTVTNYTGTVQFSSTDTTATYSPSSYTFLGTENGTYTFGVTFKTLGTYNVTANDNSTPANSGTLTGVKATIGTATKFSVTGSATTTANTVYKVTVTAQDGGGNVVTNYAGTVKITSSDTTATYLSQSYTFLGTENGTYTFDVTFHTSGTHTITATDSSTPVNSGTLTGIKVGAATATNFKVTSTSTTTTVGTTYNFTVIAQDINSVKVNDYTGTVKITSTDGSATYSPQNYTFVVGDSGTKTFSITFKTPGTHTITVNDTITSTITGTLTGITVNSAPTTNTVSKISVTSTSTTTTVGTAYSITVTAQDSSNATVTNYTGTVHFTSSDTIAILPGDYTFVVGDNGTKTFSITFKTQGIHTITVTDIITSTITGTLTGITVNAGTITVSPATLSFTGTLNASNPVSQSITITNIVGSSSSLDWSLGITYTINQPTGWLTCLPNSGSSLAAGSSVSIDCSVTNSGLAIGIYTATITINSSTGGVSATPQTVPVTFTVNSGPLVYFPLPKPIRVLDTRVGSAALYSGSNGYAKLSANTTKTYTLSGITYGGYSVPVEAQAVVANATAVLPSANGFLTIYAGPADPTGANRPLISGLNYKAQSVTSNSSYLNLDAVGAVNVYALVETDVVIDVSGYWAPSSTPDPNKFTNGLVYYPLPKPIRILDTRAGATALYNSSNGYSKFSANTTKDYTLSGITYGGYIIPDTAKAVVANTTAITPSDNGFLTIYLGPADASGANRPVISSMNYRLNAAVTSNSFHPTLGANGVVNIYSLGATDVVMDVSGYFAPLGTADPNKFSNGLSYYPLAKPIRLLDTRVNGLALYNGSNGYTKVSVGNTNTYNLNNVTYGGYTIPTTAQAVVANTTAVAPAGRGFLTMYPGPADPSGANRPLISSINYLSQITTGNATTLSLGTNGTLNVYSLATTDVVIDVSGYHAP
jgi:hypothetical protein